MKFTIAFLLSILLPASVFAQNQDVKQRTRAARDLAKQGEDAIPALAKYVTDPELNVRLEAIKSLDSIGGPKTVDPLVTALRDNDPEMQIRATDGLVNVYLPGYLKNGLSGSLHRVGTSIKGKFTDTNDQVIDAYVKVPPDVIAALGRVASGGSSLDSRANACRALGILRGRAALPDLDKALHSKDNQVMYEALIAIQKIRDLSAGPNVEFLLHDLDDRVQTTAMQTVGMLRDRGAAPDLRDAMQYARDKKVRRAALSALAMLGEPADHDLFVSNLSNKDEELREAGAEGLARLKNPGDRQMLQSAFNDEHKLGPRLSMAFALVALGNLDTSEFKPLRYLVDTLNQGSYQGVAIAYLTELARDLKVRQAIYPLLPGATKDEKEQLSIVLARSGGKDSLPYLQTLSMDSDPDVAAEGLRSLRVLQARQP